MIYVFNESLWLLFPTSPLFHFLTPDSCCKRTQSGGEKGGCQAAWRGGTLASKELNHENWNAEKFASLCPRQAMTDPPSRDRDSGRVAVTIQRQSTSLSPVCDLCSMALSIRNDQKAGVINGMFLCNWGRLQDQSTPSETLSPALGIQPSTNSFPAS